MVNVNALVMASGADHEMPETGRRWGKSPLTPNSVGDITKTQRGKAGSTWLPPPAVGTRLVGSAIETTAQQHSSATQCAWQVLPGE